MSEMQTALIEDLTSLVKSLRAELAAEKLTNGGWKREYERCGRRYEILRLELEQERADAVAAAAIRASNAAPPQPCSYPQYCGLEVCNCPPAAPPQPEATFNWDEAGETKWGTRCQFFKCPDAAFCESEGRCMRPAAPPHVEPSAAESVTKRRMVNCPQCLLMFSIETNTPTPATEARMLELARKVLGAVSGTTTSQSRQLAALVIDTFGDGL